MTKIVKLPNFQEGDTVINQAFSRRMRRPIIGVITAINDTSIHVEYPFLDITGKKKFNGWAPKQNFIKQGDLVIKENFLQRWIRKLFRL